MSKPARRHHTVPRFYLEGFVEPASKGRLHVLDASLKKHFRAKPIDVTVERDFNRFEAPGVPVDEVEKMYADAEGEIASAVKRTVETKRFATDDDRKWIATLIAMLIVRSPRMRGSLGAFMEEVNKKMLHLMAADQKRWEQQTQKMLDEGYITEQPRITFDEFRDFIKRDEYDVRFQREFYVSQELRLMDKIPRVVADRTWIVASAAKGSGGFVTCDHPPCLMWSDPKMRRGLYGPGLGLQRTQLTFPLSKDVALVGAFELKEGVIEMGASQVAMLNGATISNAARQVYCPSLTSKFLMTTGEQPKACKALLTDHRFTADERPKRPWY